MSPFPNGPGPARSQSPAIRFAVEGGNPLQRRRFPGRQRDLAMRLGKPRERIRQQKHMMPLVAEHLRRGHRHPRRPPLDQRRLVRGRRDHHRPRHALGPQHVVDEVAQLAPALADQRQNDDIRLDPPREIREQRGFAHPRPGEDPDPLALRERQNRVEHREPGIEPPAQRLAPRRLGRGAPQGGRGGSGLERPPVERLPEGIDDPPDPGRVGMHPRRPQQRHPVAHRRPVERRIGHRPCMILGDPDDLPAQLIPRPHADRHLIADPRLMREPRDLERGGAHRDHPADPPVVGDPRQLGGQGGKIGEHGASHRVRIAASALTLCSP